MQAYMWWEITQVAMVVKEVRQLGWLNAANTCPVQKGKERALLKTRVLLSSHEGMGVSHNENRMGGQGLGGCLVLQAGAVHMHGLTGSEGLL